MTQTLTLKTLIAKGACAEAVKSFAEIFPNGAPLTVETFVAVAGQFDWECAARLLLTPRNQVSFNKLVAAELFAFGAALASHAAALVARGAALAALASRGTARAALDTTLATYMTSAAFDAAYDARDAACATTFAILYIQQLAESETRS